MVALQGAQMNRRFSVIRYPMSRLCFAASIVLAGAAAIAAQTLPKPSGRITDLANVIDAATEADLDRRLDELEQKTSSEIAVVTVPSLDGAPVEDYAVRLFKEWGIGQAKSDNGVLVLVAPNEREMRIEVGYGLEGVLPDGLSGEIVREQFIPRFRDNDYNGGIRDGVARVIEVVEKQQVLSAEELARFNQSGDDMPEWLIIPFFGVFVTIGFVMVGVGLRSKTGFPLLFGSLFGGMPLLMSLAFIGRLSMFTLLPWAIVMFIVGYRQGGKKAWRDAFRNGSGSGKGSSGGWKMGGGGSSSGSSSSSSGGSSGSFGGGSSGGGGASGRW
jgi:uncharacterized protein